MQRYFAENKTNDIVTLSDNDIFHMKTVMRMKAGDLIEVVHQSRLYLCSIEKGMIIRIKEEKNSDSPSKPELTLIIPFLKEQKMDLIFQKGTELGVDQFIIIDTERSIVKIDDKKVSSRLERWSKICKEASEQSMRLDVPKLVIEREKDQLESLEGLKLICSTFEKDKTVKNFLKNAGKYDKISLMIGPEGGFSFEEEIYFEKKGFVKVSLGARILRTETVPIFLSSIINYENME